MWLELKVYNGLCGKSQKGSPLNSFSSSFSLISAKFMIIFLHCRVCMDALQCILSYTLQ